jgi:Glycosyltransferase 61
MLDPMHRLFKALRERTVAAAYRVPPLKFARRFESLASSSELKPLVIQQIEQFPRRDIAFSASLATPADVQHNMPAKAIWILRDVYLWPSLGVVGSLRGTIAEESFFSEVRQQTILRRTELRRFSIKRFECPCATLQIGSAWTGYYHWMIDVLPKVYAFRHPQIQALGPIKLLLTLDLPADQEQFLRALLPEQVTIERIDPQTRVLAPQILVIPSMAADCAGYLTAEYVEWFRRKTADYFGFDVGAAATKRIFISRQQPAIRGFTNEAELLERLRPLGVEAYQLERLSLRQQAELFFQAELVIGAHGAGLSNLVFSQTARVLEIFNQRVLNHYRILCHCLGLEYSNLIIGNQQEKNAWAEVPVAELEAAVKRLLAS